MIWTHGYDLVLRLATFIIAVVLSALIQHFGNSRAFFMASSLIFYYVLFYYCFRTFASFLYCRFTLNMKVTLAQARQFDDAFSPKFFFESKWLPMEELKNIDATNKYETALTFLKQWNKQKQQNRKQQLNAFKKLRLRTKLLTLLMYGLLGYYLIAWVLDLPPATQLVLAYCQFFDTDRYYPVLILLILMVPTVILFKVLDRDIM